VGRLSAVIRAVTGMRPRIVVPADDYLPLRVADPIDAVVVGGGIAGVSAALVLVERGVRVTLLEAAHHLGGRLGAWPHTMPDGGTQLVEHGFHGFFRQYYTWRSILRRIDPELGFLQPLAGYPVLSRQWPTEDLGRLPASPPANLLALLARSPSLRLADLRAMDRTAATCLLEFDRTATYRQFDWISAAELLDRLRLPERGRAMLFDVFARSFFNRTDQLSAAELIMMFHFYFLGNPEGLGIDAPDRDYLTCIWGPLTELLGRLGGEVVTGARVDRLESAPGGGWRAVLADAPPVDARHVVLAVDPAAVRQMVAASPALAASAPRLARQVATLATAAPYAVARFWTDRPVQPSRAPFSGVTQEPSLDAVAMPSRLEQGSMRWAGRTGGAVLELHSYACPDGLDAGTAADQMWASLRRLWPELRHVRVVDCVTRLAANAPAFPPGSDAERPGVRTDAPGLLLAGDWVRMGFPCALMERAAASGVLAANDVLGAAGVRPEPVVSVRPRGLLAARRSRFAGGGSG
jgi:carotenoid phi-ring synthase / carotenoid chi-ring synthase